MIGSFHWTTVLMQVVAVGLVGGGLGWLLERWLDRQSDRVRHASLSALVLLTGGTGCMWFAQDLARAGVPEVASIAMGGAVFVIGAIVLGWNLWMADRY